VCPTPDSWRAKFESSVLRGIFMDNLQAALDAPTALNVTVQATRRREVRRRYQLFSLVRSDAVVRSISFASAGSLTARARNVSFAAGGPNDIVARIIGQYLSERLGHDLRGCSNFAVYGADSGGASGTLPWLVANSRLIADSSS